MRFFIFKMIAIVAILLLTCLPFFPKKFKFSLASPGYTEKDRWKNICFVLETVLLGLVLLCIAPFIRNGLDWFFNLGFMRWIVDLFPERFVYIVDVVVIIISNLLVCALFLFVKKLFRNFLDTKIYKGAAVNPGDNKKKKAANKNKKTPQVQKNDKDCSEKRLQRLRRDSVLVFGRGQKNKKNPNVIAADYKVEKKKTAPKDNSNVPKTDGDESLSFGELIKLAWYKFVGLFYSEEDQYEYVKSGTYRWAKELKNFVFLLSCVYLLACLVMLLPVFFSFDSLPGFYTVAQWFVDNTYMLPMLSLIVLYELVWFLDGEHKAPEEAEAPFVTFVDSVREGKKADLAKARGAILDKYGQNYNIKNFDVAAMGGKSTYTLGDKKQSIQNMAKAIRASKGFVNGDYMQSIEYMFDGKHVLFDSALYSAVGEYIVHYLFVTLSFGTRVLFICKDTKEIENAAAYLEDGFRQITRTPQILWRISTFEKLHEGEKPDILLLTPEQFLEQSLFVDGKEFFDELVDVFVLDVDKILTANNYYCLIMAKKLEKATTDFDNGRNLDADLSVAVEKRIRYSFFSNGHVQALGNSIRQFFNLENAPLEAFHSFGLASKTEVFVWHTGVSSTLYVDNGANQVALEVQIAKDACNFGVSNINLISEAAVYSSQLNEIQGLTLNSCSLSADHPIGYVIVADDCFNLPNAIYNYSRFSGRQASVLHVVSKPYLLRDYFTAKAENYVAHFELIGKTMSEHAEAKKANIIILLCDAVNGIERSVFIKRASEILGNKLLKEECDDGAVGNEEKFDLQKCVKLCYEAAFHTDSAYEPQYSLKREQNSELEYKTFVYIKDSEQLFEKLLECTKTVKLEYINTQSVEYIPVFKDEMTQHFVPGQVIVRNNRAYTIKDMDVAAGTLVLDDTGPSVNVPMDYIQTRLYTVSNASVANAFGHDYRTKNCVVSHVGFTVYDADISVDTVGYYSIEKAVQNVDLVKPNFAKYVNLVGNDALLAKIKREIKTKMLVVEFDLATESNPHVTYSLAVILQEFMKTVFPHQYRCVSVCPLFDGDCEEAFFADDTAIRDLYPRIVGSLEEKKEETAEKGRVRLAIIEDIQGGNGVVETLVDGNGIMVTNLLHVVADFLAWVISPAGKDYNYLNFGYAQRPAVFDIEKLESIVRQFRHDVERSELVRLYSENACFFCHRLMESDQGQELEDGRTICQTCLESSVSTFAELDTCFSSVMDAIKKSTSVADTFPSDICVDFVSTAELRERYGEDEQKLPIAYCNHMTNHIYLEYGLPKASACGVIARMITELWQDCNIVSDGSPIYAGQFDYVELQTLSALRFNSEAELLSKFYEGSEGLSSLKQALNEIESKDSFAYFLGKSGKKNDGGNNGEGLEDDDDISFVAERDPKELPRFLYNHLSTEEKAVYDQIYQAIQNHAESTGSLVHAINGNRCFEILSMVIDDNPDIFWCANPPGTVSVGSDGMAKNVIFKYVMTAPEVKRRKKQIEKAVKPFLKGITISMSDYEVALRAHENIVKLIDYDSIGLDAQKRDVDRRKKPDNLRSVYGVLVEKKAVCAGYARALQYLLNRLGIECTYIKGPCHDGEWHAWNLIKLEGDYYYVDTTFDDHSNTDIRKNGNAEVSYDYFCITTNELLKSRGIHKVELYPECTATKCNYFVRSKLFFKDYDASHIRNVIVSALKAGKKEIAFKMENEAVMSMVKDRLITKKGMFDILSSIENKKQQLSYSYYCNDELHILHIIVDG